MRDVVFREGEGVEAGMGSMATPWSDGTRVGRYLIIRDADGTCHAICASAISAMCDTGDGATILLMGGGRMLRVEQELRTVLGWLEVGARP